MSSTLIAPPLDMEGMYIPQKRITIASVYPRQVVTRISRRAPTNTFTVPAGTKEKPGILIVEDTWEAKATSGGGNIRVLAEHTAQEIVDGQTVHLFRCDASQRAYPGIFLCAGDAPTPAEIEDAEGCQRRYWTVLVNAARELARKEKVSEVQEDMRLAGRELGIVGESWQLDVSKDAQKKCVWCAKFIDKAARRCSECSGFQTDADAQAFALQNAGPATPASTGPVVQAANLANTQQQRQNQPNNQQR